MHSLLRASALQQAAWIQSGKISSEELTRFYLDRIERYQPELNAFTDVFRRRALLAARLKDAIRTRRRRRDAATAPFEGVPIGIKDLNIVRGAPTRFGSSPVPDLVFPFDVYNVLQLRRGGLVIVGKRTTP